MGGEVMDSGGVGAEVALTDPRRRADVHHRAFAAVLLFDLDDEIVDETKVPTGVGGLETAARRILE